MINIRQMIKKDRKTILDMIVETEMFTTAEVDVAMELVDIYLNNKNQKDYNIIVAEEENKVLGYACYGPTPATEGTFDLYWIVVNPAHQNMGIGKKLLHYVEKKVFEAGGRLLVIETSSQQKYIPTQKFYINNDYKISAQIKDFYKPGDDRIIFTKYQKINHSEGIN
jgi:ribosomal protein S18 acetylase RimI-like enzyme